MEPTESTEQKEDVISQPIVDTSPYDLDLDLLQPQPKKVKLNGVIYLVYPPKVKTIANLARLAGELLQVTENNAQAKVREMLQVFYTIIPELENEGVDLNLDQLTALFRFVNNMANPSENSALKVMGVEPTAEKKTIVE